MLTNLSVQKCGSYESALVRQALLDVLEPLGGLDFVHPGMKIGIKCNLCIAKKPETAAVTHPVPVAELAKLLLEKGAEVIVGDSPGEPFTLPVLNTVYRVSGYKTIEEAGAILNRDTSYSTVTFPEGVTVKSFECCSWIQSCDVLINFSKLKSHGLFGMTAAVKNLFGIVPGTVKSECHFRYPDYTDFSNMLVDLCEYAKPVLHLCDAIDIMEGNGPTAGTPLHLGLLIGGKSPYEMDRFCAKLLGFKEEEIPYLTVAKRRNLLSENSPDDPDFFPALSGFTKSGATCNWFYPDEKDSFIRKTAKNAIYHLLRSKPGVTDSCTACGRCARNCPAKAIRIENGKAVISRNKCILCFCCQEFCPTGAMKAKRPLVARIIT